MVHACRTSLEELTITPPSGFHGFMNTRRERWDAMDPAPMHLQTLQTLTLQIQYSYSPPHSAWSLLDGATRILDIASMSNLASLELKFNSNVLLELSDDLGKPSLKLFQQSITHFTSPQRTVSFTSNPPRKNRRTFWAPIFARAFPLLYKQNPLKEAGQSSIFDLQAVARSPRD